MPRISENDEKIAMLMEKRSKKWLFIPFFLLVLVTYLNIDGLSINTDSLPVKILKRHPLIDGHNDLLIFLRFLYPDIYNNDFKKGMRGQVDIPRIEAGHYGGAFWSAFVPCPENVTDFSDANYAPFVKMTLEQIDLYNRLAVKYPKYFTLARSAKDASVFPNKLISPLAIEGLHQIGNSLATLRLYHSLGVRYATLTWNCHNKYADAAVITTGNKTVKSEPLHHGVSKAGQDLILEMNRLGMMVDLSHVSVDTMKSVLGGQQKQELAESQESVQEEREESIQKALRGRRLSQQPLLVEQTRKWQGSIAPPIFSHSSVYSICPHPRNVPDDVLDLVKARNSLVMINFSPDFISCEPDGDLPRYINETNTIDQVVKHIVYIGQRIGWDYVGIGSDFDGIFDVPRGLEDVSKFPDLVQKLLDFGLHEKDIAKILGGNLLRVWAEVDAVAVRLQKIMDPVVDKPV